MVETLSSMQVILELIDKFTKPMRDVQNQARAAGVDLTKLQKIVKEQGLWWDKSAGRMRDASGQFVALKDITDKVVTSTQRWQMQWLGLGFLGMQLTRTFGFLNKQIKEIYFSAELMNIQLAMIAAMDPLLQPLSETLIKLTNVFYGLPISVQGVIGAIFYLGSSIAGILGQIAFMQLGAQAVGKIIGSVALETKGLGLILIKTKAATIAWTTALGISTAALAALIGIGAVVIVWLVQVRKNWSKIREDWSHAPEDLKKVGQAWARLGALIGTHVAAIWGDLIGWIEGVREDIEPSWTAFVNTLKEGFSWAEITEAFESVGTWVTENIYDPIKDKVDGLITWFKDNFTLAKFTEAFGDPVTWGTNLVNSIKEGIEAVGYKITETLWNLIPEPLRRGITGVTKAITKLQARGAAISTIGKYYRGQAGFWEDVIPSIERFYMAQRGGVVPGPIGRPVPLIAHGGETIIPAGGGATINYSPIINITLPTATMISPATARDLARTIGDETTRDLRRMI